MYRCTKDDSIRAVRGKEELQSEGIGMIASAEHLAQRLLLYLRISHLFHIAQDMDGEV